MPLFLFCVFVTVLVLACWWSWRAQGLGDAGDLLEWRLWNNKLLPCKLRRYQAADLEKCLEIYKLNEPGRFPSGGLEKCRWSLLNPHVYKLVIEFEGGVIATGGISHNPDGRSSFLCYGLVHPDFHGRGFGCALLYGRLALLDPGREHHVVGMSCVESSLGYYLRFGFRQYGTWLDDQGNEHPCAWLSIPGEQISRIRELLRDQQIEFPLEDQNLIPRFISPGELPEPATIGKDAIR